MDLSSALSHIEALQKQLAENNAELSEVRLREEAAQNQVAQLNDVNEKLRHLLDRGEIWNPRVVVDLTGNAAAESEEIKNQVTQLNDVYGKLREWVALGLVPRPGPDDLKRMSELRVSLKTFCEVALGTQDYITGDEITPAAVMEEVG